jgi:hypothetical protein
MFAFSRSSCNITHPRLLIAEHVVPGVGPVVALTYRHERPANRGTANKRDEFPPPHLIRAQRATY